jgi:hypothetical protein
MTTKNQTIRPRRRYITMIVALHGQIGNYLGYFARAYSIKRSIEQIYNNQENKENGKEELMMQLVGQHQNKPWATRLHQEAKQCFPNMFQHLNQDHGIWNTTGIYKKYNT